MLDDIYCLRCNLNASTFEGILLFFTLVGRHRNQGKNSENMEMLLINSGAIDVVK